MSDVKMAAQLLIQRHRQNTDTEADLCPSEGEPASVAGEASRVKKTRRLTSLVQFGENSLLMGARIFSPFKGCQVGE